MPKHLRLDDCRDGRTFGQFAQLRGADVKKVGSFLEISTPKGTVHVADCDRAMPRPEQEFVYGLFIKIGLGVVAIGLVVGGLFMVMG